MGVLLVYLKHQQCQSRAGNGYKSSKHSHHRYGQHDEKNSALVEETSSVSAAMNMEARKLQDLMTFFK
jgi:methyl-accepting chemotaxis protein